MSLEIYQIILLIVIGGLVGISVSFIGQTGQGVVFPLIYLITGDVFLAIAINVLNDLITASSTSIMFIKNKQFKVRKDILLLVVIAVIIAFFGVFVLMTTPLGSIFGWFLPLFITCLGLLFVKIGFPTKESVKKTVQKIAFRALKKRGDESKLAELEKKINEQLEVESDEIEGIIPTNSRIFYLLALGFGIFMGINSGMFGANSGLVIVLALIILYGYPLKKGVGTALILSILVSASTFIIYQVLGFTIKSQFYYNLEISLFLAIGSIITGIITSFFIQKISAKVMGRLMGLVMVLLGIVSFVFFFITG
ncbi:MAG: sulfite exporter TauE/SafE family protein [Candidatus Hodarchaeota archaeon]